MNILLVEDEEALRIALVDRLRGEGYSVETASDGLDGSIRLVILVSTLSFWMWCCPIQTDSTCAAIFAKHESAHRLCS